MALSVLALGSSFLHADTIAIAAVLYVGLQDETEKLIDKLRSEKIDERDAAVQKLAAMGERALVALRNAQDHQDAEVRATIRGLIAEAVWRPVLGSGFTRRWKDGLATLRDGTVQERQNFYDEMLRAGLMSPAFAERIILNDADAALRARFAYVVCINPRPRYRESYFRLLQDWEKSGRLSERGDYLETEEYLISALAAVAEPSDLERLRAVVKAGNRTGAAELLIGEITKEIDRGRLEELARSGPYPVAARARWHLAKRHGPGGLVGIPVPSGTFARSRCELADVAGLIANGSDESIRAVNKIAEERLAAGAQSLPRNVARAGTERITRALLDRALSAREGYEIDGAVEAMCEMPAAVVLTALASRKAIAPAILVRFGHLILAHGDETMILALLRAQPAEPPNVRRWTPRDRRDEAVRASLRILDERPSVWAARFAYRLLAAQDPEGRRERARAMLTNPDHPAFLEAVEDFDLLSEKDRLALQPALTKRLEETKDRSTVYAFGRKLRPEWIEAMRKHARSSNGDTHTVALYAIAGADALTKEERLAIAKEIFDCSHLWDSIQGSITRAEFDGLRERAAAAKPHVLVSIAQALVASGDARAWPRLKEILTSGAEYPWGLASVRALTEGKTCVDDLMKAVPGLLPMQTQAAGEILPALSSFSHERVEAFLFEQLENGPMTVETGSSLVGGYDPDGPPEDAIRGLVNLRSARYRREALKIARLSESATYLTGPWSAAVEALGILDVEGGLEYVVAWLEDRERTGSRWYWDPPYLAALGYLGDARHEKLVRSFLADELTGPTAACVLDRLVNRDAYRKLREVRTIRNVGREQPRDLARLLKDEWGIEVKLPSRIEQSWRWVASWALWRADGLQVLDRLAVLLDAVPCWRDGRVEFMDVETARGYWTGRK